MFPSFKNLADREQKRLALLERTKRVVDQAYKKREMYASAAWVGSTDSKKTLPDKSSIGVQIERETNTTQANTETNTTRTRPLDANRPTPMNISDSPPPTPTISPLIPEAISHKPDAEKINNENLIKAFNSYPKLVYYSIYPVMKSTGRYNKRYKIGENGVVLTKMGNIEHGLKFDDIDWTSTYAKVVDIINTQIKAREESQSYFEKYHDKFRILAEMSEIYDSNKSLIGNRVPMFIFDDKGISHQYDRFYIINGDLIDRNTHFRVNKQQMDEFLMRFDGPRSLIQLRRAARDPNTQPPTTLSEDEVDNFVLDQNGQENAQTQTDTEMEDTTLVDPITYKNSSKARKNADRIAKNQLKTLLSNNQDKLKNSLIIPYKKDNEVLKGFSIEHGSLYVIGNHDKARYPNIEKQVSWYYTYIKFMNKIEKRLPNLNLNGINIFKTDGNISRVRAASKDLDSAGPKTPKKRIRARGLVGAGNVRVYRRGCDTYNLNDIQGTGTKSSFDYKRIGSKYIRLPDLNEGTLNIVYPSRVKVGPKRKISAELQAMIKELVHEGTISQAAYDKLPIDDKKIFREIINATHLQGQFGGQLADPIDSLKAEFNKLRGELILGNDNPSLIKQLKAVSIDMYRNKLITDKDFGEIMMV